MVSNELILVEIDELVDVNEPLIPVAVKLLINVAFVPREPEISDAICADPDNVPGAVTLIKLLPSPANEPVKEPVNGAVISVNCAELDIIKGGILASEPDGPGSPCLPRGPGLFTIIVFKIYTFSFYINIFA